jgi:hypothetical protein
MFSVYAILFVVSFTFLYMLKIISDEIMNLIDNKFVEFTNKIEQLKKENEDLKKINKNKSLSFDYNIRTPIGMYGCFH